MIGAPRTDFWRVGIVPAPVTSLLAPERLFAFHEHVRWLPDPGEWRYLADPFGLKHEGSLYVFVEAFDYRTRHGVIEYFELGASGEWVGHGVALEASVHLSYPFVFQEAGAEFMVPESHRANELVLYRADAFPGEWVREAVLLRDLPVADASLLKHEGRWWMFFTLVGPDKRDQRELHLAFADKITGPWTMHPQNPVLRDLRGARPGGTPFIGADGNVLLPVQDCSAGYGAALRLLRFNELNPRRVAAEHLAFVLTGALRSDEYRDGLQTLSACGDQTLVDVKRVARTWRRHAVNLQRKFRAALRE